jgi:UDP-2,4-diacetamido-2,4,6-trideoxy-beta-L-altropyranose hydrolase
MKVLFRVDANAEIGAGHAARCAALSGAFSATGAESVFWTTPDTARAFPPLEEAGRVVARAMDDPSADLDALPRDRFDIAVLDHYGRGLEMEAALKTRCDRLIVVDDLRRPHPDADVILDQTLGRAPSDYNGLVGDIARRLTGAGFTMLHPAFGAARLKGARRTDRLGHIVICFGGADPNNATGGVLEHLLPRLKATAPLSDRVTVVLGAAARHRSSVKRQADESEGVVTVVQGLSQADLSSLYGEADIVVGAAGTSSWERCCVGVPSVTLVTGEDQRDNAFALAEAGATILAEDSRAVVDLLEALSKDKDRLAQIGGAARAICDSDGAARVVATVLGDHDDISAFRRLSIDDAGTLFDWQTSPGTRDYFREPSPPDWATHRAWVDQSLAMGTRSATLAVSAGGAPLGLLRLDETEDGSEVSILVAPRARGRGIGSSLLDAARILRPNTRLLAEVNPGNAASLKLFRAAGYRPWRGPFLSLDPSTPT